MVLITDEARQRAFAGVAMDASERRRIFSATLAALALSFPAAVPSVHASEPPIISEQVQILASELNLIEVLGVEWSAAEPNEIEYYFDILVAIDVIAEERAAEDGRESPSNDDYKAAAYSLCFWPPNKPPEEMLVAEKERYTLHNSLTQADKRDAIKAAIGPLLLTGTLDDIQSVVMMGLDQEMYAAQIINFDRLR